LSESLEKNNSGVISLLDNDETWIGAIMYVEKLSWAGQATIFLICTSMIFSVLAYGTTETWSQPFFYFGAVLVGLLWLADAWVSRAFRFNTNYLQLPILALILIGIIQLLPFRNVSEFNQIINTPVSAAISFDPFATTITIALLFALLIYFSASLAFINTPTRLQTVNYTVIIFGFIIAVLSILQRLSGTDKIYWFRENLQQGSPFGTYINGHHFAALMVMMLGLTLGLIYSKGVGRETRTLHIIAAVTMGIAVFMSSSRGGMLSLIAVLVFITLVSFLHRNNLRDGKSSENETKTIFSGNLALFGGGLALLFLLFGAVLFLGSEEFLLRGLGFTTQADASSGRMHFWQVSVQIIRDNPILGVGLEGFGVAYTKYDTWNGTFRVERAHNDYLQTLTDTGIVGFITISLFIFLLFRRAFEILNTTQDRFRYGVCLGALAACFGVLIHSFFDFPLRTPANTLIFLILVTLATVSINYPKLYR
jgi:O-antigen ligase